MTENYRDVVVDRSGRTIVAETETQYEYKQEYEAWEAAERTRYRTLVGTSPSSEA